MRLWHRYINKNKYMECMLITALNARYYLTGEYIKQDSKEYEDLVDFCGARYGSIVRPEKMYRKLGLKIIGTFSSLFDFHYWTKKNPKYKKGSNEAMFVGGERRKKIPLPMEVTVWHKKTGFHSVCIVDHELKTGCYRIANFRYVTSIQGWLFEEDLYQYLGELNIKFRLFGLRGVKYSRYPRALTKVQRLEKENKRLRDLIEKRK